MILRKEEECEGKQQRSGDHRGVVSNWTRWAKAEDCGAGDGGIEVTPFKSGREVSAGWR